MYVNSVGTVLFLSHHWFFSFPKPWAVRDIKPLVPSCSFVADVTKISSQESRGEERVTKEEGGGEGGGEEEKRQEL